MAKRGPKVKKEINNIDKNNGRPTEYKSSYNLQVQKLCKLGATDKDIANFFNVCEKTINNWKKDYPGFLQSIKKGKVIADIKVSESLFKRATGYQHREDVFFSYKGLIISQKTTKHYAPDTTAMIFWLKNRNPSNWKDKQEVTNFNVNANVDNMSEADIDREIKKIEKLLNAGSKKK